MTWVYLSLAIISYLTGAIPFSYILVKAVSGEDIARHGTGNVGAMNVKRTTGSWGRFIIAVILDGSKGLIPVLLAKYLFVSTYALDLKMACYLAMAAAVIGHNYPIYMLLIKKRVVGGKGLATAGGALLVYNWTFLAAGIIIALAVIFLTKYLLAGQITVTLAMPVYVWFFSRPDFPFITIICIIIFAKHAPRLPGLFTGKEPKWNVKDYRQAD